MIYFNKNNIGENMYTVKIINNFQYLIYKILNENQGFMSQILIILNNIIVSSFFKHVIITRSILTLKNHSNYDNGFNKIYYIIM